ncbi:MAG: site-2 protease family protein [Candidatus Latescibacterota bacterium]
MSETVWHFLVFFPAVLVALALHEAAHAYTADRLGDPTPRRLGRVTLNPLVHLDPMGTLLLAVVHFGWGKPVPVDPRYFNQPRRDMMLVALAGPLANIATAIIFALSLRLLDHTLTPLVYAAIDALVLISLLLAVFNLLPIPPLDGSKILVGLLPDEWALRYQRYSGPLSWGLMALVLIGGVSDFNPLGAILFTPVDILYTLLVGGVSAF